MRIVHVIRRFVPHEWGGIESYVVGVSQALTQRKIQVDVFTTSALAQVGNFEFSGVSGRRFSYFYPCVPMTGTLRNTLDRKGGNPLSFSIFCQILQLPGECLIHVHTMGRLAAMVRLACRIRHFPYVVSLHAGYFCVPETESRYFKDLARNYVDWGKPLNRVFGTQKILRDAGAVLCFGTDEYLAAKHQLSQASRAKVSYLPHGIEIKNKMHSEGVEFREKYQLGDAPLLLCVARIDPQKNQLALVRALSGIRREFPGTKLVLIGPISVQPYFVEIQEEIHKRQLTQDVVIIPGLPPSSRELADAYAACDVFVLPSIHEPFGIVVLEAWSYKKPVVIAPIPSLKGVVLDGANGKWSKGPEPLQLCQAIVDLFRVPQSLKKIGEEGFNTLIKHYTHEQHMDRLCELYDAVYAKRS